MASLHRFDSSLLSTDLNPKSGSPRSLDQSVRYSPSPLSHNLRHRVAFFPLGRNSRTLCLFPTTRNTSIKLVDHVGFLRFCTFPTSIDARSASPTQLVPSQSSPHRRLASQYTLGAISILTDLAKREFPISFPIRASYPTSHILYLTSNI